MYIKTDNKEIGAKLAAHYQAGKPIEIMGKLFLGNSIGFEYPDSCVEFHGSEVSKVAWTGEGLPPVGTVCEVDYCESWQRCEVIAKFRQRCGIVAVFTVEHPGGAKSLDAFGAEYFRPIRTPEQIAEEERDEGIRSILKLWNIAPADEWNYHYDLAAKTYDAGYKP